MSCVGFDASFEIDIGNYVNWSPNCLILCGLNNKGSYKWSNKECHCVWHIGGTKIRNM
jgi:hypothetical protein